MNIKEAKQQLTDTVRAYLAKDETGSYLISPIRQRPVLLMGPPGIGKTQIMDQIASELNIGLVSYTITHHTRQSAVGLPFIEKREYNGVEYSATEYTMSEIIGSVYSLMEKTGITEGILFLDEINCVSETLAPMMLQFLQCKTFGNRKLPEGWIIAAAGNPPEYNRSVRDFDIVTLDRVKKIDITEDYGVWKEYAIKNNIHGAIISYLDIKNGNFYRMEPSENGLQFATARGWEDLSELLYAYEKLGLKADRQVVVQYIQFPEIARDFAAYLQLYYKYQQSYHIDEILQGSWSRVTATEFSAAPFDEKLAVMSLIYSGLAEASYKTRLQDSLTELIYSDLTDFKNGCSEDNPANILRQIAEKRRSELKRSIDAGRTEKEKRNVISREIKFLEECAAAIGEDGAQALEPAKKLFANVTGERESLAEETGKMFENAYAFLETAVGAGQEIVMFTTELTAGFDTAWFVGEYGCEAYFRNNKELLLDSTRSQLLRDISDRRMV